MRKKKFEHVILYFARAIGQIKSIVQILLGRVWGDKTALAKQNQFFLIPIRRFLKVFQV